MYKHTTRSCRDCDWNESAGHESGKTVEGIFPLFVLFVCMEVDNPRDERAGEILERGPGYGVSWTSRDFLCHRKISIDISSLILRYTWFFFSKP
jgi:hypothetical protein